MLPAIKGDLQKITTYIISCQAPIAAQVCGMRQHRLVKLCINGTNNSKFDLLFSVGNVLSANKRGLGAASIAK